MPFVVRVVSGIVETFPAVRMNDVYRDSSGHEWLLTDNGLGLLSADGKEPVFYFSGTAQEEATKEQPFYVCCETGKELFFGSDNGRVWRYQKGDGQFRLLQLPVPSRVVSIHCLGGDELLLATATDGFFVCNPAAGTRKHYEASRLPRRLSCRPIVTRREKSGSNRKSRELWRTSIRRPVS